MFGRSNTTQTHALSERVSRLASPQQQWIYHLVGIFLARPRITKHFGNPTRRHTPSCSHHKTTSKDTPLSIHSIIIPSQVARNRCLSVKCCEARSSFISGGITNRNAEQQKTPPLPPMIILSYLPPPIMHAANPTQSTSSDQGVFKANA